MKVTSDRSGREPHPSFQGSSDGTGVRRHVSPSPLLSACIASRKAYKRYHIEKSLKRTQLIAETLAKKEEETTGRGRKNGRRDRSCESGGQRIVRLHTGDTGRRVGPHRIYSDPPAGAGGRTAVPRLRERVRDSTTLYRVDLPPYGGTCLRPGVGY